MVISIDKATVLQMHDKVRRHWKLRGEASRAGTGSLTTYGAKAADPEKIRQCKVRLDIIRTTDMALIVSSEQNEIERMKKLGLDIAPHRKRMNDESLDENFKDLPTRCAWCSSVPCG